MKDQTTDLIVRLTENPYRVAVYVFFLLAAVWFTVRVVVLPAGRLTHGFGTYYSASRLLVTGTYSERVYDHDYFQALVRADSEGEAADVWLNPPTTIFLLLPLANLPIRVARALWIGLNVLLLFGGLALLIHTFAPGAPLAIWLLVFTIAMLFRPVIANFVLGQAYVLVFLLLVIAVVGLHRHRDVAGGLSLGPQDGRLALGPVASLAPAVALSGHLCRDDSPFITHIGALLRPSIVASFCHHA